MKIQVNTDHSVEGSVALSRLLETQIRTDLARFETRVTRFEVYLSEVGGHRGADLQKRCLLEARPTGMDPMVVTGTAETLERACHDATQKMRRLLGERFDRLDRGHDSHATIRQNEPDST